MAIRSNVQRRRLLRGNIVAAALLAIITVAGIRSSAAASGDVEIKTSGKVLRVCAVVFRDFSKYLIKEARESEASGVTADERDFDKFMSDISNYDVVIQSRRDVYDVTVSPMPYPKGVSFGGGGEYWISGTDFTIRKRLFFK